MRRTVVCVALVVVAACGAPRARPPERVAGVGGFATPESVRWDPQQDVYFVSNINGSPGDHDNNGRISVVLPAGTVRDSAFLAGGVNGVTLHAPKGMALVHDTLWVTDIDVIRAFNAVSAAPIATIAVPGAVFLNDIVAAPDGSLYVTDTAIRFGAAGIEHPGVDRIYRVAPDRSVSVALEGDTLGRPNGIAWDSAGARFLVVPFSSPSLFAWKPGDAAPAVIAAGPGGYDGVEATGAAFWVSSWADSSVYRFEGGQGTNAITGVPSPADIGYDAKRNRLVIPVFTENRLEIWQLH